MRGQTHRFEQRHIGLICNVLSFSVAQATGIVDKIIAYDTTERLASWRNKVVLVPDDPYSSATFSGDPTTNYCYRFEEEVFETISTFMSIRG